MQKGKRKDSIMKIQSGASVWVITRVLACAAAFAVAGCAQSTVDSEYSDGYVATPTVDYVERLDVYSAPHRDSFLISVNCLQTRRSRHFLARFHSQNH